MWIKSLCDVGYISVSYVPENGIEKIKIRRLKVEGNFNTHLMKTSIPPRSKLREPHEENFAENNTMNNTMNNISSSQIFDDEPSQARREQNFSENSRNLPARRKINDKASEKRKIFEANSDPYLLAKFLEKCIAKNNPKFPQNEPQRQRWAKDFDLMIRRDKIDADDIAKVIDWCQNDNFWRSNILSGKKVREKYQQLVLKMQK